MKGKSFVMGEKSGFLLRIDSDVIAKIKKQADFDGRSVNKEIEYILKEYLDEHK